MTKQSRATRIADLNDKFRKGQASDRVHMTAGINAKGLGHTNTRFVGRHGRSYQEIEGEG